MYALKLNWKVNLEFDEKEKHVDAENEIKIKIKYFFIYLKANKVCPIKILKEKLSLSKFFLQTTFYAFFENCKIPLVRTQEF